LIAERGLKLVLISEKDEIETAKKKKKFFSSKLIAQK
jgi:hypothetical protein